MEIVALWLRMLYFLKICQIIDAPSAILSVVCLAKAVASYTSRSFFGAAGLLLHRPASTRVCCKMSGQGSSGWQTGSVSAAACPGMLVGMLAKARALLLVFIKSRDEKKKTNHC